MYNRVIQSESTAEFNVNAQKYDRAIYCFNMFNSIFWGFMNFCMMRMIVSHSRSMQNEEKVLTVRNEMLIFINNSSHESTRLRDSSHLDSMIRSQELSPNQTYQEHLDEVVDEHMRSIIGAIISLTSDSPLVSSNDPSFQDNSEEISDSVSNSTMSE